MIVEPQINKLLEYTDNRYSLVIATSKRARQIAEQEEKSKSKKAEVKSVVTLAAQEIADGKIDIYRKSERDQVVIDESQIEE
jgi:DNA-directed RNA polymerase subunit omega